MQERAVHRDLRAVGQDELGPAAELLDEAEDVVPAPAVEARGVVAQLVEDLVHLEGGEDRLDQDGGADGAARDAERVLRGDEDVVPQPRLEVALQLRQVEVRPGALARSAAPALWKKKSAEVEERGGDGLARRPARASRAGASRAGAPSGSPVLGPSRVLASRPGR